MGLPTTGLSPALQSHASRPLLALLLHQPGLVKKRILAMFAGSSTGALLTGSSAGALLCDAGALGGPRGQWMRCRWNVSHQNATKNPSIVSFTLLGTARAKKVFASSLGVCTHAGTYLS